MMKRNLIFGIAVAACLAAAGYYAYDRAQGRKALIEAEEEVTAPGEFSFKKLRQKAQAMAATRIPRHPLQTRGRVVGKKQAEV